MMLSIIYLSPLDWSSNPFSRYINYKVHSNSVLFIDKSTSSISLNKSTSYSQVNTRTDLIPLGTLPYHVTPNFFYASNLLPLETHDTF